MEKAYTFQSSQNNLLGILHEPDTNPRETGILVIVGGPQTRVGSHRQFVLLARALCAQGYSVFRFDYSGMGDSEGNKANFLDASHDIGEAINEFTKVCPAIKNVVLWGLCDAASLSLLYVNATEDSRVKGLVLLNPWVRQEASEAETYVKHYYLKRITNPDLWKKFIKPDKELIRSIRDFVVMLFGVVKNKIVSKIQPNTSEVSQENKNVWPTYTDENYVDAMHQGLSKFDGYVSLILSGNDMTADEFRSLTKQSKQWKALLGRKGVTPTIFEDSNHTFSSARWRKEVELATLKFLNQL